MIATLLPGTTAAVPVRVSAAAATSSAVPGDGLRWFYFVDPVYDLGTGNDFTFGEPGDVPLIWGATWNQDLGMHVESLPAVYRDGAFLFNPERIRWPDPSAVWTVVHFGDPGDVPLVWNTNHFGVYRNATFYLSNDSFVDLPRCWDAQPESANLCDVYLGAADLTASYGDAGDVPLMGTWNYTVDPNPYTTGVNDTIGVYRPSNATFYLRNSNTTGVADVTFTYGDPGDIPLVADWNLDGVDTIGVYRPSNATFYLRNSNTTGVADVTFVFGNPGDHPVAPAPYGSGDGVAVVRFSS